MRVMSKKQGVVLQQLIRLAKGDSLLVERAIRNAGTASKTPTLDEVVTYIRSNTPQKKRA